VFVTTEVRVRNVSALNGMERDEKSGQVLIDCEFNFSIKCGPLHGLLKESSDKYMELLQ